MEYEKKAVHYKHMENKTAKCQAEFSGVWLQDELYNTNNTKGKVSMRNL